MVEFDIGAVTYRANKMDAFAQLHVSRKLAPVLPKLFPVLGALAGKGAVGAVDDIATLGTVLTPLAEALAAMPRDDVDSLCKECMTVVQRKQGDSWSPVMRNGAIMFEDIDLGVMLPMIVQVVRDSLGNFISVLLSAQANNTAIPVAPNGQDSQAEKTGS